MIFYQKRRNGIITLLVLTASLAALAETMAIITLFHRGASFLEGAREYRAASGFADQFIWRLNQGELAATGEETIDDLHFSWRREACDQPNMWRTQVMVSGFLMGRNWSTEWIVYQ